MCGYHNVVICKVDGLSSLHFNAREGCYDEEQAGGERRVSGDGCGCGTWWQNEFGRKLNKVTCCSVLLRSV